MSSPFKKKIYHIILNAYQISAYIKSTFRKTHLLGTGVPTASL